MHINVAAELMVAGSRNAPCPLLNPLRNSFPNGKEIQFQQSGDQSASLIFGHFRPKISDYITYSRGFPPRVARHFESVINFTPYSTQLHLKMSFR